MPGPKTKNGSGTPDPITFIETLFQHKQKKNIFKATLEAPFTTCAKNKEMLENLKKPLFTKSIVSKKELTKTFICAQTVKGFVAKQKIIIELFKFLFQISDENKVNKRIETLRLICKVFGEDGNHEDYNGENINKIFNNLKALGYKTSLTARSPREKIFNFIITPTEDWFFPQIDAPIRISLFKVIADLLFHVTDEGESPYNSFKEKLDLLPDFGGPLKAEQVKLSIDLIKSLKETHKTINEESTQDWHKFEGNIAFVEHSETTEKQKKSLSTIPHCTLTIKYLPDISNHFTDVNTLAADVVTLLGEKGITYSKANILNIFVNRSEPLIFIHNSKIKSLKQTISSLRKRNGVDKAINKWLQNIDSPKTNKKYSPKKIMSALNFGNKSPLRKKRTKKKLNPQTLPKKLSININGLQTRPSRHERKVHDFSSGFTPRGQTPAARGNNSQISSTLQRSPKPVQNKHRTPTEKSTPPSIRRGGFPEGTNSTMTTVTTPPTAHTNGGNSGNPPSLRRPGS